MDYTEKYLKYKSKYLELKELIAGAKPSEAERKAERARREAEVQKAKLAKAVKRGVVVEEERTTPKKTRETELMAYIKAGRIDIDTLSREYSRYEHQKNSFDEDKNIPLYVYINNTGDIDMSVISFLLPDEESLLARKNNDGDTIMHLIVKKNNLELLEELWSAGGRGAKLVNNNAGLNLLKLAERLETSREEYKGVANFLRYVYVSDNDEGIDSLLAGRQVREALLEASGFKGVSIGKSSSSLDSPKVKIVSIDERISNKSSDELLAKFNEDYTKFPTYFVFGKIQLNEKLDSGIQFESVYVEPSKIGDVPDSKNILSIKKIEMKKGLLATISSNFDGMISLVAVQSRMIFDL